MPVAVPVAVAPSATTVAHHRADCDSRSEGEQAGRDCSCRAVPRRLNRGSVNNRRVVLRHIHNLRICRLNHDRLRRLLHDRNLRARLQIARGLRLRAQSLDRSHHVGSLQVIRLSQGRGPAKVLREIIQDRRKLRKRLHARVPRLAINCLHQILAGEALVLMKPVTCGFHLVRKRRGSQNLRHHSIRVQRNRRHQLLQFVRRQRRGVLLRSRGCRLLPNRFDRSTVGNQKKRKRRRQQLLRKGPDHLSPSQEGARQPWSPVTNPYPPAIDNFPYDKSYVRRACMAAVRIRRGCIRCRAVEDSLPQPSINRLRNQRFTTPVRSRSQACALAVADVAC